MTTAKTNKGSRTGRAGGPLPPGAQHDDYYRQLRAKLTRWANEKKIDPRYRDYVLLVPDLFHFLCRLVLDRRIEARDKGWLGFALVYVMSPIDILPEVLFGPLGFLDDLIVMVVVLDQVLGRVPRRVVAQHWAGKQDLFDVVRESLAKADDWIGKGVYRRLKTYLRKQGIWPEGETASPPPVPAASSSRTASGKGSSPKRAKAAPSTSSARSAKSGKTAKRKTAAKKTATKKTAKSSATRKTASKRSASGPKAKGARRTIASRPKSGSTSSGSSGGK